MYLVLSLPEGKHMVESIFIIHHPLQKKVYNFLEHIQVSSIHTLSFIHSLALFFFLPLLYCDCRNFHFLNYALFPADRDCHSSFPVA